MKVPQRGDDNLSEYYCQSKHSQSHYSKSLVFFFHQLEPFSRKVIIKNIKLKIIIDEHKEILLLFQLYPYKHYLHLRQSLFFSSSTLYLISFYSHHMFLRNHYFRPFVRKTIPVEILDEVPLRFTIFYITTRSFTNRFHLPNVVSKAVS